MVVRVVELLNSFYKDSVEISGTEEALGDYCIWGFFDALKIKRITAGFDKKGIMRSVTDTVICDYNGLFNRKEIICIHEDEKKDDSFWKDADKKPYLYITLIRKERREDSSENVDNMMKEINCRRKQIAYYSYSHSEIIIIGYSDSCKECLDKVLRIKNMLPIFKTVTVFGIKERELGNLTNVKKERVSLRLAGKVREQENAINMVKKLDEKIQEKGVGTDYEYRAYDTLGAKDIIIEILNVPIENILPFYATGELLTHTNPEYGASFYNIETQIITEFYSNKKRGE